MGHSINSLVSSAYILPSSPSSPSTSHSSRGPPMTPEEILDRLGLDSVPGGPTFTRLPDSHGHDYEDERPLVYGDHSDLPQDVQDGIADFMQRHEDGVREHNRGLTTSSSASTATTGTTTEAPSSPHHHERRTLQYYKKFQKSSGWF